MTRKPHSDLPWKHRRRRVLDDVVLAPKYRAQPLPTKWEEDVDGELQPILAPERLYTRKDLIPYKRYYRLYQDKRYMLKRISLPSHTNV
jgi:hypothetical protein